MSAVVTALRAASSTAQPCGPVERARLCDLAELKALLGAAVPDCAPQTVWELPWTWHRYSIVRARRADDERGAGPIVACGALRIIDGELVELRGIYVAPEQRGCGLARTIVEHLLARAGHSGRLAVCVTQQPQFFRRYGFVPTAWPSWLDYGRTTRRGAPRTAMAQLARAADAADRSAARASTPLARRYA